MLSMNECHPSRKCLFFRFLGNKSGQTLVEYALTLALISVVAVGTLAAMGGQVSSTYTTINQQLTASENGGVTTAPARGH